ncbi:MAG: pantetheine-phosphate adenylyltransferase [Actinobacteria bacterium]|jgi:pantetheine-phosphate adenylyltransferase|nr:pantetheine-phosphate adenylyltransferase [Actinomycetota bacterium]MCZ6518710.1 pantetheine-phosphate adenylyltransferase [Actinomycetota bacterium]MCZ6567671.1 pantetheine-phosphate adenylyltransferase [Actinomycetota bacterium]MCZ6631734.1 pantetheine-phosphate adenylyltransferase [Actinomycetota bacterium]MCZ6737973.1 pantetheine-phosphate adenylyltransferase [Actinomycetota bacterium]
MTTALCPGSFDPPTNGHVELINRVVSAFDRVVVSVIDNPSKSSLFSVDERVGMINQIHGDDVEVTVFGGLLVDHAREVGADVVVKGLRTVDDYDYENQMAQMNRHLTGMETVFMPTHPEYGFISSSLVKEVARLGGSMSGLVPDVVESALKERLS